MNRIDVKQLELKLVTSFPKNRQVDKKANKNFSAILENIQQNGNDIKFSKHALERINIRNIKVTTDEISKLKTAMNKAEKKGISDALICMGDKVFIANVKNKVVITTANKEQLKESVFTNIDGAVII